MKGLQDTIADFAEVGDISHRHPKQITKSLD
jgi:hypothetical protein